MKDNAGEEKILAAAMNVISDKTISGTRMRLIAKEAGFAQSNINYYFKDKNEVLTKLSKHVSQYCFDFRDQFRDDYDKDSLEDQIELFIRQKLDFILDEKSYDFVEMDFWLQTRVNPEIKQSVSEGYKLWREEIDRKIISKFGASMSEKEKKDLPYVIISLLQGATIQYHLEEFDVREYFEYCKKIIKAAIQGF